MDLYLIKSALIGLALFSVFIYFLMVTVAALCIYYKTLSRSTKKKWGRVVSIPTEQTLSMDEIGIAWQKENDAHKKPVHIINDGLNLFGEYYDFGYDKAVIILSGRTESLRYGYFFAKPYADAGCNVLVLDSRCHGYSDGKFLTLGFEESKDLLAWVHFLHSEFHLEAILFHAICIGAAGGMLAITSEDCPNIVKGMVTEGMFPNFRESMRNHLIERKKLLFPVLQIIEGLFKFHTGHSMKRGPIDYISKMDKPLLMLQSLEDQYSTAENAQKMFAICPSKAKKLVLFESGRHSMLRITHTKKYDAEIASFLKNIFPTDKGVG